MKQGLWLIAAGKIKNLTFKDQAGNAISIEGLSENDITVIRNFIAQHIL